MTNTNTETAKHDTKLSVPTTPPQTLLVICGFLTQNKQNILFFTF